MMICNFFCECLYQISLCGFLQGNNTDVLSCPFSCEAGNGPNVAKCSKWTKCSQQPTENAGIINYLSCEWTRQAISMFHILLACVFLVQYQELNICINILYNVLGYSVIYLLIPFLIIFQSRTDGSTFCNLLSIYDSFFQIVYIFLSQVIYIYISTMLYIWSVIEVIRICGAPCKFIFYSIQML